MQTGILLTGNVGCPALSTGQLKKLNNWRPYFVTRHIKAEFLESARAGYYQFGTLKNYQASEAAPRGRLGDYREARAQDVATFESDNVRAFEFGAFWGQNSFNGLQQDVVQRKTANDFCSCTSIGAFNLERAHKLQELEDEPSEKVGAFVTYSLALLYTAVLSEVERRNLGKQYRILGKKVDYVEKDTQFTVTDGHRHQLRPALTQWLNIAFSKSTDFQHEDEFRILLVDKSRPGGLSEETNNFVIPSSQAIQKAIICSDFIPV